MSDITHGKGTETPHSDNGHGVLNGDRPAPVSNDGLPAAGIEDAPAYNSTSDPYGIAPVAANPVRTGLLDASDQERAEIARTPQVMPSAPPRQTPPPPPPPSSSDDEDENPEDRGMLRMSFMEHLEELRTRLLRAILGMVVAFLVSMFFTKELWQIVQEPAVTALRHLGYNPPRLIAITPMEQFNIIWLKLPLLVSVFLGSPWIFFQIWSFIAPGLYKREKRWAVPFILTTAVLFITGGCFAYFVAFRYGLEFLLGIGRDVNVTPMVTISEYFDLFVNVTLGVGLVFEMPVIIFFLTLLRLASPRFLLRHSRYAILGITVLAAVVTPTPDVFNMMIFAIPMVALFFVGVFASFLLVNKREGKKFPWTLVLLVLLGFVAVVAGVVAFFVLRYGYHFASRPPFFIR